MTPSVYLPVFATNKSLHASVTHIQTVPPSDIMQFLLTAICMSTGSWRDCATRVHLFGALAKPLTQHKGRKCLICYTKCLTSNLTNVHFTHSVHEIRCRVLYILKTLGEKSYFLSYLEPS